MLLHDEYVRLLRKAIEASLIVDQMAAQNETDEVRELIAGLQISSGRLVKILARRVAGNVKEAT